MNATDAEELERIKAQDALTGPIYARDTCGHQVLLDRRRLLRLLDESLPDAERYRWLRGDPLMPPNNPFEVLQWMDCGPRALHGDKLDAAIDSARGAK